MLVVSAPRVLTLEILAGIFADIGSVGTSLKVHEPGGPGAPMSESRVIRPGHWERAQISEMGIVGS
jgi:hypothetical protein